MPDLQALYLDMMKRILSGHGAQETFRPVRYGKLLERLPDAFATRIAAAVERAPVRLVRRCPPGVSDRTEGVDWPVSAKTMIGLKRLDNLEHCVTTVVREGVPGDLIETGVWRGGASILMGCGAPGVTSQASCGWPVDR